ncbi:MAG: hypothetical protein KDA89_02475, partial [Planctomycetaceae bacterium]|nr:hypothetical protein [Planctomycetaceae bacterium]
MNPTTRQGGVSGVMLALLGLICLGILVYFAQNAGGPAGNPEPESGNGPESAAANTSSSSGDDGTADRGTATVANSDGDDHATSESPAADSASAIPAPATPPVAKETWADWPRPTFGLMLTGEQHGYFEPCGCTSNQLGGMSRRADLYNKLTAAGWSVRGLDVGGLARRAVRQSQIKFETTLAALRELKYAAIGIGPEEIRLQPVNLIAQHLPDGDFPLYFLSANLTFFDDPAIGTPARSTVFEVGGLIVGVTSIVSDEVQKEVLPYPDVTWTDPVEALPPVLQSFDDRQVDIRVLLSQAKMGEDYANETLQLAEKFPQFDIILTANGIGDPDPNAPPKKVGNTLI